MARKSQQTFLKRQREHKKAEKAARKRARREALKDSPAPLSETTEDHAPVEEDDVAKSE